jgi:hypothetical protein
MLLELFMVLIFAELSNFSVVVVLIHLGLWCLFLRRLSCCEFVICFQV